jgi:hypothetical protein
VDARVARAAAQQFAVCCSTEFRPVRASDRHDLIPRLDAWYFRDVERLRAWGGRSFRQSIAVRQVLRRVRRVFQ